MVDIISGLRNASRVREGLEAVLTQVGNRDRVMMMLGPYMFSVGTAAPRQISRTARFSWPSQERVGKRPLLQSTGRGAETIEIEGTIFPEYKGGLRQVQAMRELAGLGKRWLLVDGLGVVYGLFAILQVDETGSVYGKRGAARRIDFSLQLEYAGRPGIMALYRAKEGEMVDEICQMYYGRTQGVVEQVYQYADNKGLADFGPRLPMGTLVELPEIVEETGSERVTLPWS